VTVQPHLLPGEKEWINAILSNYAPGCGKFGHTDDIACKSKKH